MVFCFWRNAVKSKSWRSYCNRWQANAGGVKTVLSCALSDFRQKSACVVPVGFPSFLLFVSASTPFLSEGGKHCWPLHTSLLRSPPVADTHRATPEAPVLLMGFTTTSSHDRALLCCPGPRASWKIEGVHVEVKARRLEEEEETDECQLSVLCSRSNHYIICECIKQQIAIWDKGEELEKLQTEIHVWLFNPLQDYKLCVFIGKLLHKL